MVGVGPRGSESVLARVSIVNWHGYTLYDTFVKPQEPVTDYRTWVSGVRPQDLRHAPAFSKVQKKVAELIKGKTLVGHAIRNDMKALLLSHPHYLIRDTATFAPLQQLAKTNRPSLRALVALTLGIEIQRDGDEHSSVEDARATMAVFRTQKSAWDAMLRKGGALNPNGKGVEEPAPPVEGSVVNGVKVAASSREKRKASSGGAAGAEAGAPNGRAAGGGKARPRTPAQANWWLS